MKYFRTAGVSRLSGPCTSHQYVVERVAVHARLLAHAAHELGERLLAHVGAGDHDLLVLGEHLEGPVDVEECARVGR